MDGSSKTYSTPVVRLLNVLAICTLCSSPVDSVFAGRSSEMYPNPKSSNILALSRNSSIISSAICLTSPGSSLTTRLTHTTKSFKFILHASSRPIPPSKVSRALWFSLVPSQSLQTLVVKNLLIFVRPFSVFAFFRASSIARWAFLYSAFSSKSLPFLDGMLMYFLTWGPL